MALLSKKTAPAAYLPPTMAQADSEYAARVERLVALSVALSDLARERRRIETEIAATPAPKVSASVAALLGDADADERATLLKRLAEVKLSITDHETAIALQTTRVSQQRIVASRTVCAAVKQEFGKRVAAIAEAVEAASRARSEFDALVADLEADGVTWRSLGDHTPFFMGDPRDGQAVRWLAEVRGAGYVD